MKTIKMAFIAGILFAIPFFLAAEIKTNYEDVAPDAINLAPEKYKLKPLCLNTKFTRLVPLSGLFYRTNITADRFFQILVPGIGEVHVVARKQEFEDLLKKLKPKDNIKIYGRIKHLNRVNTHKNNIYYFEVEKIEDPDNPENGKDDNKKSDSGKSDKAK